MSQLDEQRVRRYAEDHGRAVVAGDMPHVMADLDVSLHPGAGRLAAALPQPATGAEVLSVEPSGAQAVVHIRYDGPDGTTTIRSVWQDRQGRPVIIEAVPV